VTTQRSRKRAADREYKKNAEQRFIRARGICERCGREPATQTHHVQRRSNLVNHDVENLRALCGGPGGGCHDWIHANVGDAKAEGWIDPEWPQIEVR
jgi:5-methylcytosine-specific restriction endonuclease McrA